METQRNLLTISLLAICAILYFKWVDFSALKQQPPQEQVQEDNGIPKLAAVAATSSDADVPNIGDVEIPQATPDIQNDTLITVTTDMVVATINTKGGVIERLELRKHLADIENPDIGFALLKNESNDVLIVQDGLVPIAKSSESSNHQTVFLHEKTDYQLGSNEQVEVPLTWVSEDGIKFVKTFVFKRDDYRINFTLQKGNAVNSQVAKGNRHSRRNRDDNIRSAKLHNRNIQSLPCRTQRFKRSG